MKALQTITIAITLLYSANIFAQTEETKDATSYKAEAFGSVSSGSTTPFWMVSNRYGIVPLDANNGYLNAGVFHQQHLGKVSTGAQDWILLLRFPAITMCSFNRFMQS